MSAPAFLPSLLSFWSANGFDPSNKSFVLGVSGGADSVALLEFFVREVLPRWGGSVSAVHVNHRLRPDSGLDQALVEQLCADRGVPLHVETLDPSTRRAGQSVEMWAREQRYAAFARAAARFGSDVILTAHHRDDAVETFFLRQWRGTGLAGLAGIPFTRAFLRADGAACEIARPLLPVDRAALQAWLGELGTPWREDASNADARIARNWLRHKLLPSLRAGDPQLDETVFRITRTVVAMLPAWENWTRVEHPLETVIDRGGIPVEWLRAGMEVEALKNCLPALGVAAPAPELMAELLRQARRQAKRQPAGANPKIQVRIDESTVLLEKRGILTRSHSVFSRKT